MKGKKFLAWIALCALVIPNGITAAADSLITDLAVCVSADGTTELQNRISMAKESKDDETLYWVNIKDETVSHAKISFENADTTTVLFAPDTVTKDTYFPLAENEQVKITASAETVQEEYVIQFNYVPQRKEHTTTATAILNQEFQLDLNELFSDKDGDAMTFSYKLNDAEEVAITEESSFVYTPTTLGTDTVLFYAQDAGCKADSNVERASFRMEINVQKDAIISALSFTYPGVTTVSLSPQFDSATDQYILNVPEGIAYVAPVYADGEAEKCYINGKNNVTAIPTNQASFTITYQEGVLDKTYTFTYNHLPQYVGPTTINVERGNNVSVSLASLFTDSDEDELNVTASGVVDATIEEGAWVFAPTAENQETEVTFTANDGKATISQTVAINTITMDNAMLKSLEVAVSDETDGTFVAKPFQTAFLANCYSYLMELDSGADYGKVRLEKVADASNVKIVLRKKSSADKIIQMDEPFEISRRENTTLLITVIDDTTDPQTAKTYTVILNRPPEFDPSFPDKIENIATGQEFSFQYESLIYDYEAERVPTLAAYDAATGTAVGTFDEDEDEKKVWKYTPTTDGTVNVRFVITDEAGSVAEKTIPVTAKKDTQAPVWGNDKISVRVRDNTSVTVTWPRPSDNDVDMNGTGGVANIKSYTIYYQRQSSSRKASVTVTAGKNIERKAIIKELTPGYYYEFYITAEDRSGNVSEASPTTRCTMPSTNNGGNNNSSNSSNNSGSIGGTTYVPIVTPQPTTTPTTPTTGTFSDMTAEYAWAQTAVTELAKAGVINGIGNNLFAPANEVTRADFLVMLFRALNVQYTVVDNFDDVPEGSYYYQTIGMAKAMGVATGTGDNLFYPTRSITREEMMTLTYRILNQLGKLSVQAGSATFQDIDQVSGYAVQAVQVLHMNGIIAGDDNGNVNPRANTRRCEAATMIYRIWSK